MLEFWNTGILENWNPGKFQIPIFLEDWKFPIIQYFERKYWNTETLSNYNIPLFPEKILESHGILENSISSTISKGNIGILHITIFLEDILEYWNIGILENSNIQIGKLKYSKPRKFQYSNIFFRIPKNSVNIVILENSNILIFTEEILEYWEILENWNPVKFQYSNILENFNIPNFPVDILEY